MEKITSKENTKIKILRKLSHKKYREKYGFFIVENLKIILEAKQSPKIIFSSDKKILEKLSAEEKYFVNEKLIRYASNLDTPSGIIALYEISQKAIDFSDSTIYLNAINDPGNLGTILRTALAFGFNNIIVDEACADIYNPKTISASKGAIFKLSIIQDKKLALLKKIKKKMPIISTRLNNGKEPEKFGGKKICLVLGSEAHGASKQIQKMSNDFIKLKMTGDMESLNVAIACGIILYQFQK